MGRNLNRDFGGSIFVKEKSQRVSASNARRIQNRLRLAIREALNRIMNGTYMRNDVEKRLNADYKKIQ
jgi:hypothetical protein